MASDVANGDGRGVSLWRIFGWGGALALLLLPLIAMQFTSEVAWDGADFIFAGVMFAVTGGMIELGARMRRNNAYRVAVAIAVLSGLVLVWINLAVGIIGSENNPANLMFAAVLAVGFIGTLIARFEAEGMALAMTAMAIAQAVVAAIAFAMGHFTFVLAGFFAALWLISAALFRKAAREQAGAA